MHFLGKTTYLHFFDITILYNTHLKMSFSSLTYLFVVWYIPIVISISDLVFVYNIIFLKSVSINFQINNKNKNFHLDTM